jgi:protein gp37
LAQNYPSTELSFNPVKYENARMNFHERVSNMDTKMENSKIAWCDHTFNPWIGCQKVSPGCDHCYAEAMMDHRYGKVEWGPHGERKRTGDATWKQPLRWAKQANGGRPRVFCASLADWLDNKVPREWRSDLGRLIEATPELDWLLLTKRPENYAKLAPWPLDKIPSNVWLGVTAEEVATENGRNRSRLDHLWRRTHTGVRPRIRWRRFCRSLHRPFFQSISWALAALPMAFALKSGHGDGKKDGTPVESFLGDELPEHARPTVARALRASSLWLALWLVPVILLLITLGRANVFSEIAIFFSKMAVVTFGGAYAVLAYVAQQAVENYGWLEPGEMLDGLGMAETTPGPLIMVLQFVGFMAAYRDPGVLSPMLAGTLGGLLATWVTFIPCFLWIFPGGAVRRGSARQQGCRRRAFNHHGGSGGRGPQSRDLVCAAHDLSRCPAGARLRRLVRHAGTGERRSLGAGALDRGGRRNLPFQGGNDHDAHGELPGRDRTAPRRGCCMKF